MSRSITSHIRLLFFGACCLIVLITLTAAWFALEDLEHTMIKMDQLAELDHFKHQYDLHTPLHLHTALQTVVYLPHGSNAQTELPVVFQGLPVPFYGETDFLDQEHEIIIEQLPEGTFYFAKDMKHFTERETIMTLGLLSLATLLILLSYGLSRYVSRLISYPIEKLSSDIQNASRTGTTQSLPENYAAQELNQISHAFNQYLNKIESLLLRERSLTTMASHELRTPIAVILGASEILQQRDNLNPKDRKTLQRIITSAEVMSENVQTLLTLVRHSKTDLTFTSSSLNDLIEKVLNDFCDNHPQQSSRIQWLNPDINIEARHNPVLVRMLIINLLSNALNHNSGAVEVELKSHHIEVRDQAADDDMTAQAVILGSDKSTGLGLYIVNLICDALHWRFELDTSQKNAAIAKVIFAK